ncbi:MAG: radical SAM protein [Planctomycetota bacterium]
MQRTLAHLRTMGFRGRIVLGGPQISYAGKGVAKLYPDAGVFIRGYGELAILQLARSSGRPSIPGVLYAGDKDRVEQATLDPADLPSPWLAETILLQRGGFIRWETKRGCPYRCAFCQHKEQGQALKHRERSLGDVFAEVRAFCRAGVADIAVLDPVFNAGRNACKILHEFVHHGFTGRLSLQCRAELVNTEFLDLAERLNVCLEFGLQTIHSAEMKAIGRANNLGRIEQALAGVRARNIEHEVSVIFGLPEQTLASFISTVRWCLDQQVAVIKAFPLMLLRGTKARSRTGALGAETGGDNHAHGRDRVEHIYGERLGDAMAGV